MRGLIIFTAVLLTACGRGDSDPTLDEIIDRHTQARGGAALIESVQAVRVLLEITEPGFTVTGDYVATRDGHMRIDIFADGTRVFTEALGAGGGWQMMADGSVKDLTEEGLKALRRGLEGNLYGLHERWGLGYRYSLVGRTEHGGEPAFELEEIAHDGFSKHLYLSTETYRIIGDVRTAALHPDIDSTEQRQETFYSAFEPTDGLLYSTLSQARDMDTGELMQTVRTTGRTLNPEIDPLIFDRPNPSPQE